MPTPRQNQKSCFPMLNAKSNAAHLLLLQRTEKELIFTKEINIFAPNAINMSRKAINRIKVVLVEKNLSSKWLAEQLGKNEATISRWCTNDVQPTLNTLASIAELLNVQITDLINNEQKLING